MTGATPTTLGRAFDLYRRTATSRSAIALVIANAIPIAGVLFFGWSLWTILVIFWVENGIVGFWNVPRIWLAQGPVLSLLPDMPIDAAMSATGNAAEAEELRRRWARARATGAANLLQGSGGGIARVAMSAFFLVHYGMFWFVHGIFVFALPNFLSFRGGCMDVLPESLPLEPGPFVFGSAGCGSPFGEVVWSNVAIAAVALFLSHGASFFLNYVGRREYLATSAIRQMTAPYGRVVVLHLTIIFGAFFIAILGAPIGLLLVLVVLKTAFDLGLHLREHRGGSAPAPPGFDPEPA